MTSYYVYYRVDPARLDAVRTDVAALLAAIERQTGVKGRWLRRRDEPTTYMEVYEAVTDASGFESILEREGARLGLQRHVERFVSA